MKTDYCPKICDYYDGSIPEFFHSNIRKARKEHKCYECSKTISKGEIYEHVFGKWEGDICVFKTCSICKRIRDDFYSCYIYGELYESFYNDFGFKIDEVPNDESK